VVVPFINSPLVQQEFIPQAVLGMDVLSQAKSGHAKTAVFVLATLQQLEPANSEVSKIVLCHTWELASMTFKLLRLMPRGCGYPRLGSEPARPSSPRH